MPDGKKICYCCFVGFVCIAFAVMMIMDNRKLNYYKRQVEMYSNKLKLYSDKLKLCRGEDSFRSYKLEWGNRDAVDTVMGIVQDINLTPDIVDEKKGGSICWYGQELLNKTGLYKICIEDSHIPSDYPELGQNEFLTYTIKKDISDDEYKAVMQTDIRNASVWYDSQTMELSVRSYRHGNNISILYTILKMVDGEVMDVIQNIQKTKVKTTTSKGDEQKSSTPLIANEQIETMLKYIRCSTGNMSSKECRED